jgi:pyridoxine 5-phosphate synthase
VPDAPDVLTSESGWDVISNMNQLSDIVLQFKEQKIRVSLFLDPNPEMVYAARETGANRVEFYTGDYSKNYHNDLQKAIFEHQKSALAARNCMLGINAGHDLNLENLKYYKMNIEGLLEVSIGHALVCDAIYFGLENVIQMYKNLLK